MSEGECETLSEEKSEISFERLKCEVCNHPLT